MLMGWHMIFQVNWRFLFAGQALYSQLILLALQDRPFPFQIVQGISKGCTDFCKRRIKGVPDFSDLSADDQLKLISANVPLLHVFQEAGCINVPDYGLNKGQFYIFIKIQTKFS